jgi:arabinan endo-1,5-alpha-L-arabinosidase
MKRLPLLTLFLLFVPLFLSGQNPLPGTKSAATKLSDLRWRDMCILPDQASGTYYIVGPGGRGVRAYTSKDLINWEGPKMIYSAPSDVWGGIPIVSIWAPELHFYKGKYYLFLTFDTRNKFSEQWRNWLPRVTRGSQILVSDSPEGPFVPFKNHSTLPVDMMTLDGTLWVENGTPYMVYCHEWVQVTNGAVGYVQLKDDLSDTVGIPKNLFRGSQAPWGKISEQYGCHVTDGPYLYMGKTGKLYMIWTSGSQTGNALGIAISDSGKLAGPWRQQAEPVYKDNGGHGMLFKTFAGRLMMILHSPYNGNTRPHIYEMEDTGETLRIVKELTAN